MFDLKQTDQAKADSRTIGGFVEAISEKQFGYDHFTVVVKLKARPLGWENARIGRALVDFANGGWSPFGGFGAICGTELDFSVRVSGND